MTTRCWAVFTVCALLLGLLTASSHADDRPAPPRLPITAKWSIELATAVVNQPVADGDRIFLALRSAHFAAYSAADGKPLWRVDKNVSSPFAAADGLVFVSAGDAVEALRATDGATAWLVPRLKTAAPLVVDRGLLFAVTSDEIVAIRVKDGSIAWRQPAGGVKEPPAIDGEQLYLGADDGRITAMDVADGTLRWEKPVFVPGGVTAIAAGGGRVYAGGGDKRFYCLDGRRGGIKWSSLAGAIVSGHIAVDGERVYFSALNNVIRALDRDTGNQRWKAAVNRRPIGGVGVLGHVVFVPVAGNELIMFYALDGARSGVIPLPGEPSRDTPPALRETDAGLELFVVTGGLSNQWHLTHIGPAGEAALVPLASLTMPGVAFLTDPALVPLAQVLPVVFADPMLQSVADIGWPISMDEPPLVPLTTLPGLQLRPLSPVLPPRRGA